MRKGKEREDGNSNDIGILPEGKYFKCSVSEKSENAGHSIGKRKVWLILSKKDWPKIGKIA